MLILYVNIRLTDRKEIVTHAQVFPQVLKEN